MAENTKVIATGDFMMNPVRVPHVADNFGRNLFIVVVLIEVIAGIVAAVV